MEDQSADSGDLTTDIASVPQGKAARSRHRLPRQKARQLASDAEPADAEDGVYETEIVARPGEEPDVATSDQATSDQATSDQSTSDQATSEDATSEVETAVVEPPVHNADFDAEETTSGAGTGADEAGDPEPAPVLVPHRPAGRVLKAAAVAAGVLFIAAGAFAGATIQPYLADRAAVHEKFEIAETAASAITTLWTYTPDDMAKLPDRSARYLSNDFANEYRTYIDGIAETNKQAQVTNNTQVLGAAVESLQPTEATAIVYTNSVSTSPLTKGIPSLKYFSYRLTLKRDDSRWLVTQMVAVTKLDLTPRL